MHAKLLFFQRIDGERVLRRDRSTGGGVGP
jgi:hypothetical protein